MINKDTITIDCREIEIGSIPVECDRPPFIEMRAIVKLPQRATVEGTVTRVSKSDFEDDKYYVGVKIA